MDDSDLEPGRTNITNLRAAVAAHLAGFHWDVIAERYGFASPMTAKVTVERFIGETFTSSDLQAARNKSLSRKEKVLQGIWWDATHPFLSDTEGKATDQRNEAHLASVDRAIRVMEGIDRLLGLNAPTQIEVYRPEASEFLEVLATLKAKELEGKPSEGDIFDAEIMDDDDEPEAPDATETDAESEQSEQ